MWDVEVRVFFGSMAKLLALAGVACSPEFDLNGMQAGMRHARRPEQFLAFGLQGSDEMQEWHVRTIFTMMFECQSSGTLANARVKCKSAKSDILQRFIVWFQVDPSMRVPAPRNRKTNLRGKAKRKACAFARGSCWRTSSWTPSPLLCCFSDQLFIVRLSNWMPWRPPSIQQYALAWNPFNPAVSTSKGIV